ncbi:MAG: MarR family transcriptional regulator [Acidobacteriaceae bacterium]|nr:MarR family transcriptional regulator [Acidobacteriaceae bacterium]
MSRTSTLNAPQIWTALARAHRAISIAAERSVTGLGLGLSDFMALEALLHKGPLTITEIQDKVLLATGSMTAAVDRLERRGLIVRTTTAEDRRARVLELTPEGTRLIEKAYRQHAADLESAMEVLTQTEKRQLFAGLRKLDESAAAWNKERKK